MASKLSMLAKLGNFKDLTSVFDSEEEKPKPTDKEKKEEDKRKEAQQLAEEERKKKHQKAEYQREKVRENIRQKYGIEKPSGKTDRKVLVDQIAKDYDMTEEDAKALQVQMSKDAVERLESKEKIEKKLDRRRKKMEMKQQVTEKCPVQ